MDQGGSPIIKLGLLLKTWRKPREQRWLMLMDKQRHGGRFPWWSIVIPAPSQKPWEPWGAGSFHLLILWAWLLPSSCVCAASVRAHLLPRGSASCCCHWWKSLSVGSSYGTTWTHSDGFFREGQCYSTASRKIISFSLLAAPAEISLTPLTYRIQLCYWEKLQSKRLAPILFSLINHLELFHSKKKKLEGWVGKG